MTYLVEVMAQGITSKRAQRRLRGRARAEVTLQAARQACQAFPVASFPVAPPMLLAGERPAAVPPTLVGAILADPPGRKACAPVTSRVRLALASPHSHHPQRPPARAPALPRRAVAPPRLLVPQPGSNSHAGIDRAAIARRQHAVRRGETRRSVAAMLVATLALGGLVALDPFPPPADVGPRIAARPDSPAIAPRPAPIELAVPEALRPRPTQQTPPTEQFAALPPVAGIPSTTPRPMVETPPADGIEPPTVAGPAASSSPDVALAEPPDSHLYDLPRRPSRQASLPQAPRPNTAPPAHLMAFAPVVTVPETPLPQVGAREAAAARRPVLSEPPSGDAPTRAPTPHLPADDLATTPAFEQRLVLAAHDLTKIPGGYDPKYMKIAYPMGDVPEGMGVCSDVIVRAYRGMGIDLQQLVHQARLGTGDTNVDHRRVQVLSRFFQKYGESLSPSPFPENYKPGDIVAYDVPWGRTSKWHIAIVTDRLSPSLRPMVVHNRGYGAKLEDALFHKRIIGHYRFNAANLQAMPADVQTARAVADGKTQRRAVARVGTPRS